MQIDQSCPCAKRLSTIFITVLLAATLVLPAQAQKFKVLHAFKGTDGYGPNGQLVRDAAGNIYGTTGAGGTRMCSDQDGCGTAFKMNESGELLWLHSFDGVDGSGPAAGLLRDKEGNLYGTSATGGKIDDQICPNGIRCGVAFKLNNVGKETILHRFSGPPDGYFPEAQLVQDDAGNLYGTTYIGGSNNAGTVFKINRAGKESVLYSFNGGSDGCYPYAGVILDSVGNLYGVTLEGGDGFCNDGVGVVFKVDVSGNETVLHTLGAGTGRIRQRNYSLTPRGTSME